jgi:hypothetical protein
MSKIKGSKRIVFEDTDVRHAKLKIRLQHDGMTQAEFFRTLITGYIEKDSLVLEFINKYKKKNRKQAKKAIKMIEKDLTEGQRKMEQFGIADGELEDIFDLIANEHPDL